MRIIELRSTNVMRLHAVAIRPDRSIVRITGANGSGKSSVLNSIFYAIAGAANHPTQPIRTGSNKATIRLDLGENGEVEYSIIRRFTPSGTTLDVEAPSGATFKKPQALLDRLIGQLTFDPLAFARMAPKARLEQLRGLVTLDVDLDALDGAVARAYAERTEVNREAKSLTERRNHVFAQWVPPLDTEPVDLAPLLDQMERASARNADVERQKAAWSVDLRKVGQLEDEITRIGGQIDALTRRRDELGTTLAALAASCQERTVPEPIDTALLRVAIDEATKANAERAHHRALGAQLRAAEAAETAAIDRATALTARITELTETKRSAIAAAKMPIEGLSFGEGEITYNDLPFSQASQAEQIRVATAIGMALNPKLRILCIRDGSLLDGTSLKLIEQMAEEHDFQVWLEMVDTSGAVGISMVDGAVAAVDGVPVPAEEEGEVTVVGAAL